MHLESIHKFRRIYYSELFDEISKKINNDPNIDIEDNDLFNLGLISSSDKAKKPDYKKVFTKKYQHPFELLELEGLQTLESNLSESSKKLFRSYLKSLPEFKWNDYTYIDLTGYVKTLTYSFVYGFYVLDQLGFNINDYFAGKDYVKDNNKELVTKEYVSGYLNSNDKDKFVEALRVIFSNIAYHKLINDELFLGILMSNNEDAIDLLVSIFKASDDSESLRLFILNGIRDASFETTQKFFKVIQDKNLIKSASMKQFFTIYSRLNEIIDDSETADFGQYILDCVLNDRLDLHQESNDPLKVYAALYIRELKYKDSCHYIYNNYQGRPTNIKIIMILFIEMCISKRVFSQKFGVNDYFIHHLIKKESDPILLSDLFSLFNYKSIFNFAFFNDKPIFDKKALLETLLDKYIPIIKEQKNLKVYRFEELELEEKTVIYGEQLYIYSMILNLVDELDLYYERAYEYTVFEHSIGIYSKFSDIKNYSNPYVRNAVIKACLSNKKNVRDGCYWRVIDNLDLTRDEYLYLSTGFKSKRSDFRQNLSEIMKGCSAEVLMEIISTLLAHKNVQNRDAALSLIKDNSEKLESTTGSLASEFEKIKAVIKGTSFSKEMEEEKEILIGKEEAVECGCLFDESYDVEIPTVTYNNGVLQEFLSLDYRYDSKASSSNRYIDLIKAFYKVIIDHDGKKIQINTNYGETYEEVIGESLKYIHFNRAHMDIQAVNGNKDFNKIKDLYILGDEVFKLKDLINKEDLLPLKLINNALEILGTGKANSNYQDLFEKLASDKKFPLLSDTLQDIEKISSDEYTNFKYCFNLIERYYSLEEGFDISKKYSEYFLTYYMYLLSFISHELANPTANKYSNGFFFANLQAKRDNNKEMCCACCKNRITNLLNEYLLNWGLNKENVFFDDTFAFNVFLNDINTRSLEELSIPTTLYFISKGYLKKDFLYKLLFDTYESVLDFENNGHCHKAPKALEVEKDLLNDLYVYLKKCNGDKENEIYKIGNEIFTNAHNYMIDFESKRSEIDTEYTEKLMSLRAYPGANNFAKIVFKMGNLKYATGCNWEPTGKANVFSTIIAKSVPEKELSQEDFNKIIDQYEIAKEKLINAGIYNINYISFIENYLKIDGLSELAYYFFYHTNYEAYLYSDEEEARLKKYSQIDSYDLTQGRMDIDWFKRAYKKVGKKNYELVFKAVKNIASTINHKRSKYCADAVLGELTTAEAEVQIFEKRNLPMVVAYGVIPLKGNKGKAALKRYLTIKEFLKGSSEFGAQKRSNERVAAKHCLSNLAHTYGVSRVRFQWVMDVLSDSYMKAFSPQQVEDITIHISLDNIESPKLVVIKKGKSLKSVPANLKKYEVIQEINDIKKGLKDQYQESLLALEKAINDEEVFTLKELQEINKHPVVSRITKDLLFTNEDKVGFVTEDKLVSFDDEVVLTGKDKLKIAHPTYLNELGMLEKWQDYIISNKIKQPFKQIFRDISI